MRYISSLIRRILFVSLLGCLALSTPMELSAQRKAQSGEALLKEIKRAEEQSLPRTAIKAGEELTQLGHTQHNLYYILKGLNAVWSNWSRIDRKKPTNTYKVLHELQSATWLKPYEAAMLDLYALGCYVGTMPSYFYREDVLRSKAKDSTLYDPSDWTMPQYQELYQRLVGELRRSGSTLTEPLGIYRNVFYRSEEQRTIGTETLGTELIRILANLYGDARGEKSGLTHFFPDMLGWIRPIAFAGSSVYFRSLVDFHSLRLQLSPVDGGVTKARAEELIYAFADKYVATPEIANYIAQLRSYYPRNGLAYAAFLEYFMRRATHLSAEEKKRLRTDHHNALANTYSLSVPERVTGHDQLTVELREAYLVRRVHLRLYVAPTILRPDQVEWKLTDLSHPIQEQTLTLQLDSLGFAEKQKATFTLPRVGNYCVQVEAETDPRSSTKGSPEKHYLYYTKLMVLEQTDPTDGSRLQWLEAMSGRPLSATSISLYEEADRYGREGEPEYTLLKKLKTDALGRIRYDEDAELYALSDASDPIRMSDRYLASEDPDEDFAYDPNARAEMIWITPDRPAYRPGQTVHVYGWTAEVGRLIESARSATGRSVLIRLYDANRKEIAQREVVPSRQGNFAVDFTLPTDRLSGTYSVRAFFQQPARRGVYTARSSAQWFQVTEYKRHATELTLTRPDAPYRLGQTVQIPGLVRTLSGSGVSGAQVTYRLEAHRYSWHPWARRGGSRQDTKILADSTLVTDSEGRFVIPATLQEFQPTPADTDEPEYFSWYSYSLGVTTTDATGESHTESVYLPVGRSVGEIRVSVPFLINKERGEGTMNFSMYGQDETDDPLVVTYALRQGDRELARGTAKLDSVIQLRPILGSLPAGRYTLTYSADYGKGVRYEGRRTIYLYDGRSDKRLPGLRMPLFAQFSAETYSPTRPPRIYWMSGLEGGYIFYEVYYEGGRITEGLLRSRAEAINTLQIPLPKGGFTPDEVYVRFHTLNHGSLTEGTLSIAREQPKRELTLSWDTFRDRIQAGSEEQWRFTLRHEGRQVENASIAVWMYDAALDEFGSLRSGFDGLTLSSLSIDSLPRDEYRSNLRFYPRGSLPTPPWTKQDKEDEPWGEFVTPKVPTPPTKSADEYDSSPTSYEHESGIQEIALYEEISAYKASSVVSEVNVRGLASISLAESTVSATTKMRVQGISEATMTKDATTSSASRSTQRLAPLSLRTNFNESAYFYPSLQTDKQGRVSWKARVPETLTRWKLIILGHTADMKLLHRVETIEAYKDFNVRPNVPRFLREGDSVRISTTVSNGSKVTQRGLFALELFDTKTSKTLYSREEDFELTAGSSRDITLPVSGYEGLDSVGLRVTARGRTSSDGEQHRIPVISDKEETIETIAFTLSRQGRHEIALDSLYPQNGFFPEQGRLDLRIESNPLYLALSALPDLGYLRGASALDAATALYAQSVALEVAHAEGFREWFEARWQALPATQRSRLRADDSLKLQSHANTPWMGVADREADREATLLKYLQNPTQEVPLSRILKQLSDLQLSDGHWCWYPGMKGSSYVTESVLRLLLRLPSYSRIEQADRLRIEEMIRRGFRSLEKEIIKEYRSALRAKKKYGYSYSDLDYLYLVALAEHRGLYKPEGEVARARNFYYTELKRQAYKLPLSDKALATVVFAYGRDLDLAKRLIASLREHLQQDKTGMFYANEVFRGYFWINRTMPTMTSTLEAMRIVSPEAERETMSEMQRWIINQKRATSWSSSLSTAEAIYALSLDLGGKNAPRRTNVSTVELPFSDGQVFRQEGAYIEATLPFTATARPERRMTVTTQSDGEVWGAAFARYTIPTSQIEARGREIQIRRETFVEVLRDGKPTLLPLTEGYTLRVGDRLRTQITLRLDQNLDFITLRDPRPGFAEPVDQTARYAWGAGTGYYIEPKDKETNFYFDRLLRGEYVLVYDQYVTRTGLYSGLVTRVQSAYAPEYSAHTGAAPRQLVLQMK